MQKCNVPQIRNIANLHSINETIQLQFTAEPRLHIDTSIGTYSRYKQNRHITIHCLKQEFIQILYIAKTYLFDICNVLRTGPKREMYIVQ